MSESANNVLKHRARQKQRRAEVIRKEESDGALLQLALYSPPVQEAVLLPRFKSYVELVDGGTRAPPIKLSMNVH